MGQYDSYTDGTIAADTSSLPSPILWALVDAESERPGMWMDDFEDFYAMPYEETLPTTVGDWMGMRMFTSSSATATFADLEGGHLILTEATDNEGLVIGRGTYPYKIIVDAGELVFEARVKRDEITGTHGFFLGLIEDVAFTATVPITATTTILSNNNLVGFHNEEADPDGVNTTYKANDITVVSVETDVATLVADTYIKLGMVFNRQGDNVLRFYVDGQETGTSKLIPSTVGDDFPNDVRLGWVFAILNGAGAAMVDTIDWIRVAQKRITATG